MARIFIFQHTQANTLIKPSSGADRFLAGCLQELQIHHHTTSCGQPQPCTAEYPRPMIQQSQLLPIPQPQQPLLLQRRKHPDLVNSNATMMQVQPMNQAIYCLAEQAVHTRTLKGPITTTTLRPLKWRPSLQPNTPASTRPSTARIPSTRPYCMATSN